MIPQYVYLIGLYLGDGTLGYTGRTYQLRLTLDARYPGIVDAAATAIRDVVPHGRVHERARRGARVLESGWKDWPQLFPQHGRGAKHTREIALTAWQRALVDEYPRDLLRGLIHSDGCHVVNRFTVDLPSGRRVEYSYPRYFFSNLSSDIRGLSASTASSWACAGPVPITATSACRTGTALRYSTASSARSADSSWLEPPR